MDTRFAQLSFDHSVIFHIHLLQERGERTDRRSVLAVRTDGPYFQNPNILDAWLAEFYYQWSSAARTFRYQELRNRFIPSEFLTSLTALAVSLRTGISKLYPPISLSMSMHFPIISMRDDPTMK